MRKRLLLTALALILAEAGPAVAGSFFGPIYGAAYYREFPQRTRCGRRTGHACLPPGYPAPAPSCMPAPTAPVPAPVESAPMPRPVR
jgi:hypothetical protein